MIPVSVKFALSDDVFEITDLNADSVILTGCTGDTYCTIEKVKIYFDCPPGDVNCDGEVTIADAVLLQKWLLAVPDTQLSYWQNADLCKDDKLDVFDLCLLKQMIIEQKDTYTIRLEDAGKKPTSVAFIIHQYLECSLVEARDRVAAAPVKITDSATKAEADQLVADLEGAGATVTVTKN
ncbi:dockerin type I repeat-containing protein [Ruminococcus flavefaciens]|uniref:dockerin type I repeat-containing protein n=1 Tax=Ruminococcus flavefaciens TaxID=1265 RepID=UPI00048C74DD|nr:ribosomal protein L7/L12 [Ruminococcus flavefaciens]